MTEQPEGHQAIAELVAAYHLYGASRADEDFWAWERVADIVRGPVADAAWELVLALVRTAPDERLDYIGAGPVEDLVNRHGPVLINRIEGEANHDPRFCEALASIWLIAEDIPSDVLSRLQAVTRGRIRVATQAQIDAANEGLS